MKPFIHDDFMLQSAAARRLYHEHAEGLPIIDYHNHLDPRDLAEDRVFENITRLWIASDPYKHRAMRIAGVPERCITGDATDREKFDYWAATVPKTLGNPLYHWTALELKRFFDIEEPLGPDSAGRIWEACNERLKEKEFSARGLIARCNVECLCTSDGLLDDLHHHEALAQSGFATRVLPSLRADELLNDNSGTLPEWLNRLGGQTGIIIESFEKYFESIAHRLDYFTKLGCRLLDCALSEFIYWGHMLPDPQEFKKLASGKLTRPKWQIEVDSPDLLRVKSIMMHELGLQCARRQWTMQIHLGAWRRTSTRLRNLVGPAGGYATIGRQHDFPSLCRFLNELETENSLPRTILYNLNPVDNAALATLTGSFTEDGVPGKIQFGPAWWYNDHAHGIRNHLDALANYGLLSTFIGMTTDSRSLLSMTRHEYFRRVLCDWLGAQVESGLLPNDDALLGGLIRKVCIENAREYLKLI